MSRFFLISLAVLVSVILCFALSHSAEAKVIKAELKAEVDNRKGQAGAEPVCSCPAKVGFTGTVTVDAPGKVEYIFSRSDGAIDKKTKTLVFEKAGTQNVTDTWTIRKTYKGWIAIKVKAPNDFESDKASFTLRCGEEQPRQIRPGGQ